MKWTELGPQSRVIRKSKLVARMKEENKKKEEKEEDDLEITLNKQIDLRAED